jgi:arylsulfatase A-like enzyme
MSPGTLAASQATQGNALGCPPPSPPSTTIRPPMHPRLPALLLLLALLATACRGERAGIPVIPRKGGLSGAARGWNVLLLSVDTLRADHLGIYGYTAHPTSPRMDALLASGVRFASAMSQRAATWPSLASVLTGLYPQAHGVTENGYGFPDDLPTLPKLLSGAGYRTAAFLSNMCQANHRGWDDFACSAGQDGKTVRRALDWAAAPPPNGRPFFLWVHLFGAHSPYYNGGDAARRLFDPGYQGELGPKRWRLDAVMTERRRLDAHDINYLNALYDAAVLGSDHHVGTLLDGLKGSGRLARTLIVFLSDHGEELYAHNGYLYHSCSVYQTALHVPLGFAAPGLLPAGATVPQTVELIDVAPTLLDLLGVAPPKEQHGRPLTPYLERPGSGGAGKPAFSEYGEAPIHTVLEGGWKLVDNPTGFDPVCIPNMAPHGQFPIAREELYDLARDPGERQNLAAREPARLALLQERIRRRFAGLGNRRRHQEIPEELRKQLEALGYAEH